MQFPSSASLLGTSHYESYMCNMPLTDLSTKFFVFTSCVYCVCVGEGVAYNNYGLYFIFQRITISNNDDSIEMVPLLQLPVCH